MGEEVLSGSYIRRDFVPVRHLVVRESVAVDTRVGDRVDCRRRRLRIPDRVENDFQARELDRSAGEVLRGGLRGAVECETQGVRPHQALVRPQGGEDDCGKHLAVYCASFEDFHVFFCRFCFAVLLVGSCQLYCPRVHRLSHRQPSAELLSDPLDRPVPGTQPPRRRQDRHRQAARAGQADQGEDLEKEQLNCCAIRTRTTFQHTLSVRVE